MATTEHHRHQLYRRLIDTIGSDEADTLMELLPPVGWADVTTKTDLHHQNEVTAAQFVAVDRRFEEIDRRFEDIDRRFDDVLTEMRDGFRSMTETIDLKVQSSQNLILAELHRTMRVNLIVTIGVLGTLITVMAGITAGR